MVGLRASGVRALSAACPPGPAGLLRTGAVAAADGEVEAGADEDKEALLGEIDDGDGFRAATSFAKAA